ncbi:MAG: 3alpha(or 20beta)-hydroxysteroid dehydrogenase [Chloroflexi bacterium]|jgi:3alpha(or 20beta)-hydroxysteroid dehydrogenase|nr:MAG: 3alpha(or 20beta)-hydroxysteroid dehydrogenase [Chloroflexota bacterium]
MAGRLDGKVALITGGARGQGAAEAALFANEGAAVVITDVLDTEGAATAAAIDGCRYLHQDVRDEARWNEVVAEIVANEGRLNVLINNAGIFPVQSMMETSLEDYRRVIEINQVGVFLGMKAVVPAMRADGGGSIVNISSVAGMLATPGSFGYGASKWAVRGMTKSAAHDLGPDRIRVNSIHPGIIETAMIHNLPEYDADPESIVRKIPLGRAGEPEDIAQLALFLASDDASYISAGEYLIDGAFMR